MFNTLKNLVLCLTVIANEAAFASDIWVNATTTRDYTWQANFHLVYQDRYVGYCQYLEFAFEVRLPNGTTYWDNGGLAPLGWYAARLPYNETNGTVALPIHALATYHDYNDN